MNHDTWNTHLSRCVISVIFGIILVVSGFGCASNANLPPSQHTLLTRELQPSEGNALVYIYYEKFSAKPTEAALNGASSEINRNSYVVWEIEPGTYPLTFTFKGGTFMTEVVEASITCEADHTYYYALAGHDKDSHEIVPVDAEIGQEKIGKYDIVSWFKDGVLVEKDAKE